MLALTRPCMSSTNSKRVPLGRPARVKGAGYNRAAHNRRKHSSDRLPGECIDGHVGSNKGSQAATKGGEWYTDLPEGARPMASTKSRCSPPPLAPRAMCPMRQQVRSKATSAPMMQQRCLFVVHCGRNALAKQRYAEASLKATAAARDPRPARRHAWATPRHVSAPTAVLSILKPHSGLGPHPRFRGATRINIQGTWRDVPLSTELAAGGLPAHRRNHELVTTSRVTKATSRIPQNTVQTLGSMMCTALSWPLPRGRSNERVHALRRAVNDPFCV